jgi:hypothetical protein
VRSFSRGRTVVVEAGAAGGGEGIGEHAHGDVMVERCPGADLVLVQADQVLALLVAFLDLPATLHS